MDKIYAILIKKGEKRIEAVPKIIREDVKRVLENEEV